MAVWVNRLRVCSTDRGRLQLWDLGPWGSYENRGEILVVEQEEKSWNRRRTATRVFFGSSGDFSTLKEVRVKVCFKTFERFDFRTRGSKIGVGG